MKSLEKWRFYNPDLEKIGACQVLWEASHNMIHHLIRQEMIFLKDILKNSVKTHYICYNIVRKGVIYE